MAFECILFPNYTPLDITERKTNFKLNNVNDPSTSIHVYRLDL